MKFFFYNMWNWKVYDPRFELFNIIMMPSLGNNEHILIIDLCNFSLHIEWEAKKNGKS